MEFQGGKTERCILVESTVSGRVNERVWMKMILAGILAIIWRKTCE